MNDNYNYGTELEVEPSFALDESDQGIHILIKHDYYSSDNDNGRMLLDKFLQSLLLISDRISCLILVDTAVRLINSSDGLNELISAVTLTLVCSDSAGYYGIDLPSAALPPSVRAIPAGALSEMIIESPPNLVLE